MPDARWVSRSTDESLTVAAANAERNGRGRARSTFLDGDAAQITPLLAPADVIVSNILRLINVALLPEIQAALRRAESPFSPAWS